MTLCVIVLAVMLKREKRRQWNSRGALLRHHESKESGFQMGVPVYGDANRDINSKWNREEHASDAHMLGGQQVHELGTHSWYELPPSGRAK